MLKLFSATVANANIGSLQSLHTFLYKCLYHLLVKFEQNRMVKSTQNFHLGGGDKKPGFKNLFWQSADAILEDLSATVTLFNA